MRLHSRQCPLAPTDTILVLIKTSKQSGAREPLLPLAGARGTPGVQRLRHPPPAGCPSGAPSSSSALASLPASGHSERWRLAADRALAPKKATQPSLLTLWGSPQMDASVQLPGVGALADCPWPRCSSGASSALPGVGSRPALGAGGGPGVGAPAEPREYTTPPGGGTARPWFPRSQSPGSHSSFRTAALTLVGPPLPRPRSTRCPALRTQRCRPAPAWRW